MKNSSSGSVTVKSHTRDGHMVKSYTRGGKFKIPKSKGGREPLFLANEAKSGISDFINSYESNSLSAAVKHTANYLNIGKSTKAKSVLASFIKYHHPDKFNSK